MKNTLSDLNNALFEEIERLQDDSLDEERLEIEIRRATTVGKIAQNIINNGNLALNVKKHLDEFGAGDKYKIPLLGIGDDKKAN